MSRLKLQWVKFTKFQFTMLTGSPSVPHPPSVQHISSIQKGQSFSAPKIPQFNTKNPSVQHNPLSSTPKTPQFHTKNPSVQHNPLSSTPKTPEFHSPQFHTQNPSVPAPSVPHQKPLSSTHPLSSLI